MFHMSLQSIIHGDGRLVKTILDPCINYLPRALLANLAEGFFAHIVFDAANRLAFVNDCFKHIAS